MEKVVSINVSNRHIHLTKETYDMLFDTPMTVVKKLNQNGEFASDKVVTLCANGYEIANVKILGPFRKYNQVEISHHDALKFKLNPPVRESGNLLDAETITIKTEKTSLDIKGCIIAERHLHLTLEEAQKLGVVNHQKISLKIDGVKSGIIDIYVKISDNAFEEVHIDTDDANAFLLEKNSKGTLLL